jgi:hypothetical protein
MITSLLLYLLIAQAGPVVNGPELMIPGSWIIAAISAIGAATALVVSKLNLGRAKEKGAAEERAKQSVTVENNPLNVRFAEEFVSRREFDAHRAEFQSGMIKVEGLFTQTMQKIDLRDEAQSQKMDRQYERVMEAMALAGKEDRLGRVAIWNDLNPLAKKLEAVAATSDVAKEIGKLSEAIIKTHGNKPSTNR